MKPLWRLGLSVHSMTRLRRLGRGESGRTCVPQAGRLRWSPGGRALVHGYSAEDGGWGCLFMALLDAR